MRKISILLTLIIVSTAVALCAEPVKNIIFLIGDGMGLTSVSMMQIEGGYESTIFDRADNIALTKTYSLDNRVTDSAASGTALATGSKTNNTYVGMLPDGSTTVSLMEVAAQQGMATGVVVTTYLQHATPAAFYAHSLSRHDYHLITRQLVESKLDVAIGGGMGHFVEVYGSKCDAEAVLRDRGFGVLHNMNALRDEDGAQRVIALLSDWEVGADSGSYLADATTEALRLLELRDQNNGFVLMVEGSLIDGMGHANDAAAMKREMQSFMGAVEVAVSYAENHPDTLVVVTADHETGGMSVISGNSDFNLSEQGVEYCFATKGHSGVMVPVYLYGAAAESINGIIENAELGAKLKELIR